MFSVNGEIGQVEYLSFTRAEQGAQAGSSDDPETTRRSTRTSEARKSDMRRTEVETSRAQAICAQAMRATDDDCEADAESASAKGLGLLEFSLLLLGPQNDAVAPARESNVTDELQLPLASYWTACSHNSYVVGDQLTGRSSADACKSWPAGRAGALS